MTTPRLAVLGSGLMGIGIAVHLARHGHAVRLQDVDPGRLAEVAATARTLLAELEEADIAVDTEAVIGRLTTTTELAELADCDLLFEAVPERLELKHRLYAQLEAVLRPDALIASNTSGLPPDELAAHLRHPERLLVAHFWNPPHFIPLVELVPGTATLPAHLEAVRQLLEAADLEAVVLQRAIPGFVGNRLQFALLREALHIVQSGVADAETVDRVMRASLGRRYAMVGPLEAADMGGLDTFRDIARHLWPTLARDEAPLQLLDDQVAAGRTGLRSGHGFHEWDAARRERIVQRRLHQLRHALKP